MYNVWDVIDVNDFVVGSALAWAKGASVDGVEGAKCTSGVNSDSVLIAFLSPLVDEDV